MLTNSPRRDYKVTAWSCFSDEKKKRKKLVHSKDREISSEKGFTQQLKISSVTIKWLNEFHKNYF